VVASDEGDATGISHFECQQQKQGFHRVITSVDKISQKQVVFVRTFSSHFEEFH
jgi:hypothetical protein